MLNRIIVCWSLGLALAFSLALAASESDATAPTATRDAHTLVVYKDPNCGCCGKWAEHMEAHGFSVESVLDSYLNARKRALGVPDGLWSCHTAVIDGYVIEGHVPASEVERLLEERPEGTGLAVPGMPLGSPGMEYNDRRQAYDVLLFDASGEAARFEHYPARN